MDFKVIKTLVIYKDLYSAKLLRIISLKNAALKYSVTTSIKRIIMMMDTAITYIIKFSIAVP